MIVGNRGFFPDVLAKEGRRDILDVLRQNGYGAVSLSQTADAIAEALGNYLAWDVYRH